MRHECLGDRGQELGAAQIHPALPRFIGGSDGKKSPSGLACSIGVHMAQRIFEIPRRSFPSASNKTGASLELHRVCVNRGQTWRGGLGGPSLVHTDHRLCGCIVFPKQTWVQLQRRRGASCGEFPAFPTSRLHMLDATVIVESNRPIARTFRSRAGLARAQIRSEQWSLVDVEACASAVQLSLIAFTS